MKRKIKSDSGFTLAELLIVVAIIGVLVAIAIPIFTGQLEKSREAVDLSDVRSAYAEVMMAAITGDTSAMYTKDGSNSTIYQNGVYTITVKPLKQQKPGWATPLPITIGGVSSTDTTHWRGDPGAGGSCEITYWPDSDSVTFVWSGGTSGGNGNGGTSGGDGENGGGTSGSDGENTGGDSNNGDNNSSANLPDGFYASAIDYDRARENQTSYTIKQGHIYRSSTGELYFAKITRELDSWGVKNATVEELVKWNTFFKYTNKVFDISDFASQRQDVHNGDVCKAGNTYYFFCGGSDGVNNVTEGPIRTPWHWVQLVLN